MLGATSIAAFDEGTAESEVAANLYPSLRDAILSSHPWNFATRQVWLARLEEGPVADHPSAFQLPNDALRAISAGHHARGRGIPYRILGRTLHCDASGIVLTYVARVAEETFPAFFVQALITRLAAEFCLPLTESTSRAEALHRLAEIELRRARTADAQEEAPKALEDFTLIEVRR